MKKAFLVVFLPLFIFFGYCAADEKNDVLEATAAADENTLDSKEDVKKTEEEDFLEMVKNDHEDFSLYKFVASPFSEFRNWDSMSSSCLYDEKLGVAYVEVPMRRLSCKSLDVSMYASSGTFSLFARNDKNRKVSLLSSGNGGKNTAIYLKIDDVAYKLNDSFAFSKRVRRTKNGAQLCYAKKGGAQVVVDFSFEKTTPSRRADSIIIDLLVTNISSRNHTYDVRAILDTILGEAADCPFRSGIGRPVDKEFVFWGRSIDAEKYIECSDGRTSMQIPFFGEKLTKVESVSVGSITALESKGWGVDAAKSRGFNDYLSSMNTGIMLDWPDFDLTPGETRKVSFCIVTGTDGYAPRAVFYTDGYVPESLKTKEEVKAEVIKAEDENQKEENSPVLSEEIPSQIEIEESPKIEEVSSEEIETKNASDFNSMPIYDYQLDPQYIQALIDRINELHAEPDKADREEIIRLNAELDAILEKLRRR